MRRLASIGFADAALGLLMSAPLSGTVAAQTGYPPGGVPTLSISDSTVTRGQTITANVSGFQPGTSGVMTIASSVVRPLGSATVDGSGEFSLAVTIPTDISLGAHTITATGTGANGLPASASAAVTVVGPEGGGVGATGPLPRTGAASIAPLTAAGVGLVLIGAIAIATVRRRRTAQAIGS